MSTLKALKDNIYIIIPIMILVSFVAIPFVYSDDNLDHYRDDSSGVFSPGYLNVAKYQAEAIVSQQEKPKSLLQNISEYLQGKTENTVQQDAVDKPLPALQKKQSSGGKTKSSAQTTASTGPPLIDSTNYVVNMGSGTDQLNANWNPVQAGEAIYSEIINGVRHVYVGFNAYSTDIGEIQQAANYLSSTGGIVLVKSGTYTGTLSMTSNVTLYGGYTINDQNELVRDIVNTPTIINSVSAYNAQSAEINGFTIQANGAWSDTTFNCFYGNVTIVNNDFIGNNNFYLLRISGTGLIQNNRFSGAMNDVQVFDNSNISIIGNIFGATMSDPVEAYLGANVTLKDNDFFSCFRDVSAWSSATINSSGNNFSDSQGAGLYSWMSGNIISANDYFSQGQGSAWSGGNISVSSPHITQNTHTAQQYDTKILSANYSENSAAAGRLVGNKIVLPVWEGAPERSVLLDLIAWEPRTGSLHSRTGQVVVLGEAVIAEALAFEGKGLVGRVAIAASPLAWLQRLSAGESPVLVVDWRRAWSALGGLGGLVADSVELGEKLDKHVRPPPLPRPSILVAAL